MQAFQNRFLQRYYAKAVFNTKGSSNFSTIPELLERSNMESIWTKDNTVHLQDINWVDVSVEVVFLVLYSYLYGKTMHWNGDRQANLACTWNESNILWYFLKKVERD